MFTATVDDAYLGCWKENSSESILQGFTQDLLANTIQSCMSTCVKKGIEVTNCSLVKCNCSLKKS